MESANWRLKDTAGRVVVIHPAAVTTESLHVYFLFQVNVSQPRPIFNQKSYDI